MNSIDTDLLMKYISRVEKLAEDLEAINADIKAVLEEAKATGFDVKYVKKMVALRKMDKDELAETDELTKLYRKAIGL